MEETNLKVRMKSAAREHQKVTKSSQRDLEKPLKEIEAQMLTIQLPDSHPMHNDRKKQLPQPQLDKRTDGRVKK